MVNFVAFSSSSGGWLCSTSYAMEKNPQFKNEVGCMKRSKDEYDELRDTAFTQLTRV